MSRRELATARQEVPAVQAGAWSAQTAFSGTPREPRFGLLRFELGIFLLLVATFAAVLFKDSIVDRHLTVDAANMGQFNGYWYADNTSGGKSTSTNVPGDPLRWSCDLRAGFAYPFCGSGILFDTAHNGHGRDLSQYEKIVIDLDYQGPSRQLKIAIKNSDPRYANPAAGDSVKPNVLPFAVKPGFNHIELNLGDAAVEQWWAAAHNAIADAAKPQFDNVVAIDIQTGENAQLGHHDLRLRQITISGAAMTPEHWYLVLLGCWTGIAALYLVWRVVGMRRAYAIRQQMLEAESRQLQESRDAAESASQAKSRFLAHMSHELRTPLNAILGYAQILTATGQTERQVAAARTIQQSGEHLLSLITEILDLSRIEAGKLDLAPRPIDLRLMVHSVADMMVVRAQEKDVVFHWTIAPDVPRGVLGDDKCLRQVLINLIGNAIKFTDQGEVRLQLSCLASGGGDVRLRFDVRDTGSGIAADKLQAIFEPFEQAGDGAQRAGGTGLGLSISRRIVELMGGEMRVESTVGVGSRFWFDVSLPLADNNALPAATADGESSGGSVREPRAVFDAVPVGKDMDRLHELARCGNMRAIKAEAQRLIREEPQVRRFAEEILTLAKSFQSQTILELIEEHKSESVAV